MTAGNINRKSPNSAYRKDDPTTRIMFPNPFLPTLTTTPIYFMHHR